MLSGCDREKGKILNVAQLTLIALILHADFELSEMRALQLRRLAGARWLGAADWCNSHAQ